MQILPDSQIKEAITILHSGGVIAHATETCYGFACDLTNPDAVKKLFALKDRPEGMPVSALFPSVDAAKEWVEWGDVAEELAGKYLPGALTIVLPVSDNQKPKTKNQKPTMGVRISSHPIAQHLAELAGIPLSTTSANLHGQPSPYSVDDIIAQFESKDLQPDLVLDSGVLSNTKPSTVVSVVNDNVTVLRQGSICIE